jgi:hypothetical protein
MLPQLKGSEQKWQWNLSASSKECQKINQHKINLLADITLSNAAHLKFLSLQ